MKILITGAGGQLGAVMADAWRQRHEVVALGRTTLDITDNQVVTARMQEIQPDAVVNCAAYNDVDRAEHDWPTAVQINSLAVRNLATSCALVGAVLVHYSTDFVFDGMTSRPYSEEDATNPKSAYGRSKLLGERFALTLPTAYILRLESLFGGARRNNSIDRIVEALSEGREATVFADRTVSPSYAVDVIAATAALLERRAAPGLYHCVSSGYCSWHELAIEIAAVMGVRDTARLVPISMTDAMLPAQRPKFAALANDKLSAIIPMPSWRNALSRHLHAREAISSSAAHVSC